MNMIVDSYAMLNFNRNNSVKSMASNFALIENKDLLKVNSYQISPITPLWKRATLQPLPTNVILYKSSPYAENMQPARDMETLKMQIRCAQAGTDQVAKAISSCTFRPREMAFTTLINLCGRLRDWKKSKEVFDTMLKIKNLTPNTYTYSALISAYACSGQIDMAIETFKKMKEVAKLDNECKPNHVTFCALVTACQRFSRYQSSVDIYEEMKAAGFVPDKVTFMSLISATEMLGDWRRMESNLEALHQNGYHGSIVTYVKMLEYYANIKDSEKALKLFITFQELGLDVDVDACEALMKVFENCGEIDMCLNLLESMEENKVPFTVSVFNLAMRAVAVGKRWSDCLFIFRKLVEAEVVPDQDTIAPIIEALIESGCDDKAQDLVQVQEKLSSLN